MQHKYTFYPTPTQVRQLGLTALLFLLIFPVLAQVTAVQVKDLFPGSDGSEIKSLTNVNGVLYFSAKTPFNGTELYKSDGTEAGTVLVKDINPGGSHSFPENLTNVNGVLFFTAFNPGDDGFGLYKSDGTVAGTVLVKDINPNNFSAHFRNLTNVNGVLYFTAFNPGTNGSALWKSDGTEAGTVLIKELYPGSGPATPQHFTDVNGVLYFTANDPNLGVELWKSNGTEAGTVMVKDIHPGGGSSSPEYLTNVNGVLYFSAFDPDNGFDAFRGAELWKSDGTVAGTVLVKDIIPGWDGSAPRGLTNVNGVLYFSANDNINGDELWKSDGTIAGTVLVKDIFPGSVQSFPENLTNVNGLLYFTVNNGTNGRELYKSNGTAAGTVLVKDIFPGSGSSSSQALTNVSGVLYFIADNGTAGNELWKSDGTAAGTVLVKDIVAGSGSSSSQGLTNVNGVLFFSANDGTTGDELWKAAIIQPIVITQGPTPTSQRLCAGGTATATVTATGTSLTYQWYKNQPNTNEPVAGQTSATLTLSNVTAAQSGNYYLRVTGDGGVVWSSAFALTVDPSFTFYADTDNDGYSNGTTEQACTKPAGYKLSSDLTATSGDCNDAVAGINPGATEVCDGIDNNCNGSIDEGFTNTDGDAFADCVDHDDDNDGILDGADCAPSDANKWRTGNFYVDTDGDGYGAGTSVSLCYGTNTPTGYSTVSGDCNDGNVAIKPGATEICDGIDNNCDGSIDEGFANTDGDALTDCVDTDDDNDGTLDGADCAPLDATKWRTGNFYTDSDGDGYGAGVLVSLCYGTNTPTGYSTVSGDCNDGDAAIKPGATEVCDGIDNNCNGSIDEGFTNTDGDALADCVDPDDDNDGTLDGADCAPLDANKWRTGNFYTDGDGDGYGAGVSVSLCYGTNTPTGYSTVSGDCNDGDAAIKPGATEVCDGLDNNCDGSTDEGFTNTDGDNIADCVDPDDDNDGTLDANDCAALDASKWRTGTFYIDGDGDGYGAGTSVNLCYGAIAPAGYSAAAGDCNDGNSAIKPGATEVCDGIDNNCNGSIDEGFTNTDGDALADCVDPDDDNDGILDGADCAPLDATKWRTGNFYADGDGDGYGSGTSVSLCYGATTPTGYSTVAGDCNDGNANIHSPQTYYRDADGDGYGSSTTTSVCSLTAPAGFVTRTGDCNDSDPAISPAAVEVCGNGIDDNCNGRVDEQPCYPCLNATGLTTTNITATSAKLNWIATANPVQWQVQYKTTKLGSKWVDVLLTGDKRSVTISSLLANQEYNWHIRAKCGKNWTEYSGAISFKNLAVSANVVSKNTVTEAVSISTVTESGPAKINLYPNPSIGQFMLELHLAGKINAAAKIQMVNITGQTVYTVNGNMANGILQKTIAIPSFIANGFYWVKITVNNKIHQVKLIYSK